MTKPKLVLATDLDGTFLGGLMRERYKLYEAIRRHREHVMLVYVTGRSLTNVTCLLDDIPVPDYIIGSTGASVFRHADGDWEVVEPVQGWIDESWGNSRQKVIEMLEGERGLVLDTCDECFYQASPLDCDECSKLSKVSFYYDDTASLGTLREMITEAGFTPIISHGAFLDIMPCGVSKGPSLKRLLEHIGHSADSCIVAGDTCNDLSMFTEKFRGIVVSNAEEELSAAVDGMSWVYKSRAKGAGGIWEGLTEFFGHSWLGEF